MSKRNVVWLVVIVVVGVVVSLVLGVWWGIGAAAAVLVISEVFERIARARRRKAREEVS